MICFNLFLFITISFRFDLGTIILFISASIAASTLLESPPIGRTSPLTDKEPVRAVSCLIGSFFKEEIIAV